MPGIKPLSVFSLLILCFLASACDPGEPARLSGPPRDSRVTLKPGRHNFGQVSLEIPDGWDVSYMRGRFGWGELISQRDALSGSVPAERLWFNLHRSTENKYPWDGEVLSFQTGTARQGSLKSFAERACRNNSGTLPLVQLGEDAWGFTISLAGQHFKMVAIQPLGSDVYIVYSLYKHNWAWRLAEDILLSAEEAR